MTNYEKIKELPIKEMAEFLTVVEASAYKELNIELSDDEIRDMYNEMMEMLLREYPPYLGVVV